MKRRRWHPLLILPFVGTLLPWLYNRAEPAAFRHAVLLLVPARVGAATALLLGIVVFLTRERDDV